MKRLAQISRVCTNGVVTGLVGDLDVHAPGLQHLSSRGEHSYRGGGTSPEPLPTGK
jgi:hypothetical protein